MTLRRATGQGTVYRRKDGRYEAAAYLQTTAGTKKRVRVYANSRALAHSKLAAAIEQERQGVPVPEKSWRLGDYLDYWLTIVKQAKRPKTYLGYESIARLYLKPNLGSRRLTQLRVAELQAYFDGQLRDGKSTRTVQKQRTVLSAALSRAQREELLTRNVAHHVELPQWRRKPITPWTAEQLGTFLAAARTERYYPAFLILALYGLRSGEVRGLRWRDIDFTGGRIHVRNQLQHFDGQLRLCPVKTSAGERDLPLLDLARTVLAGHRDARMHDDDLVFISPYGNPVDEWTLLRALRRVSAEAKLPSITVHHLRHTTATLLKNIGVPARDAQLILGHATISTTQQLYQHADLTGQHAALVRLENLLASADSIDRSRQIQPSNGQSLQTKLQNNFGGSSQTRTGDTRLFRLGGDDDEETLTEVLTHARVRALHQMLGIVAVNCSRQVDGLGNPQNAELLVLATLSASIRTALAMRSTPTPSENHPNVVPADTRS